MGPRAVSAIQDDLRLPPRVRDRVVAIGEVPNPGTGPAHHRVGSEGEFLELDNVGEAVGNGRPSLGQYWEVIVALSNGHAIQKDSCSELDFSDLSS